MPPHSSWDAQESVYADLPALNWIDPTGNRAFFCDGFISHRRHDTSAALAHSLGGLGVRVWHDGNADLSHRDVRNHIRHALMSSRTIIVCVDADRPLSGWCRAEYEPALQVGIKYGFERVVVALLSDDSVVPRELEGCRMFRASCETPGLVQFLLHANQIPMETARQLRSLIQHRRICLGQLPFDEIAVLAEQRLDRIETDASDDPLALEVWARDFFSTDLRLPIAGWIEGEVEIATTTVEPLAKLIFRYGKLLLGRPDILARFAPFEIVDFMLAPLGWVQTNASYFEMARCVFARLCLAVAKNTKYASNAAAWLVFSERLASNASVSEARMALWEALDRVYAMDEHNKNVMMCGSPSQAAKDKALINESSSQGISQCQ